MFLVVTVAVERFQYQVAYSSDIGQDGALVLLGLMAEYLTELDPLQAEVKAQQCATSPRH